MEGGNRTGRDLGGGTREVRRIFYHPVWYHTIQEGQNPGPIMGWN